MGFCDELRAEAGHRDGNVGKAVRRSEPPSKKMAAAAEASAGQVDRQGDLGGHHQRCCCKSFEPFPKACGVNGGAGECVRKTQRVSSEQRVVRAFLTGGR